jgi:sugar phosphate isomerase/epimerase
VAAGTAEAGQHLAHLAQVLRYLARQAEALGLVVAVENHGDAAGNPEDLARLVEAVDRPNLGACLDFGNFAPGQAPEGVQVLAPYAVHAHAKCWAFDSAGNETRLDYAATLAALRRAGFRGAISIEYEGDAEPNAAVGQARELVEKSWVESG